MRIFTLILTLSFTIPGFSQITITQADLPSGGDIFTRAIADTFLQLNPAPTGANYTWDYSTLTSLTTTTDTFLSMSQVPFQFSFLFAGSANQALSFSLDQAIGQVQLNDVYRFFNSTSSAYTDAGFAGSINGIPLPMIYDVPDKLYALPMEMADTFYSQSDAEFTIPNVITYARSVDRQNYVDGYGTLYLPGDTFQVLRLRSEVLQRDSIMVSGSPTPIVVQQATTEYKWMAKGSGLPVLQINTLQVGGASITTQTTYYTNPSAPVGIQTQRPQAFNVFPNPVGSGQSIHITMQGEAHEIIRMWNHQGVLVGEWTVTPGRQTIQLPALPKGMYFMGYRPNRATPLVVQ